MKHLLVKGVRLRMQLQEVIGDDNTWFCSQCYNEPVKDIDLLWRYFVEQGGAEDFARRWTEAMSDVNRYFAHKHYDREITDEQTLWEYYMANVAPDSLVLKRDDCRKWN